MKTTGKFDHNGDEIFEGDKVLYYWGWFQWKGKIRHRCRIHTITIRDAYKMGNGEMRDDGGGKIFCLGKAYNSWEGEDALKLTKEEVDKIRIEDDVDLFFDDDGKAIVFTDQHLMGLSDEAWQNVLNKRKEMEFNLFFKNITSLPDNK